MVADFADLGRQRGERVGGLLREMVETIERVANEREVDLDEYVDLARETMAGVPDRHLAEFEGMVDAVGIDEERLALYGFASSDLASDISDAADGDEDPADDPEGCTNVVVSGDRTADGRPLILKNRDISARGIRPQGLFEQPPIDDYHGFISLTTCGEAFVFQGVNERGLVAANTFVDAEDEDVSRAGRIRNGVLVRRVLEECTDVADARALVADLDVNRVRGLTLALADERDAALIELDGEQDESRPAEGSVIVRTNHFPADEDAGGESSRARLARARELADDLPDVVGVDDLFGIARDHENGPGPNSICRHPTDDDGPLALGRSTTVSTAVFRGGESAFRGIVGNGCGSEPERYAYGEDHPDALLTGDRWRELVGGRTVDRGASESARAAQSR